MPEGTMDIIKSNPIETLQSASKINLQGGGALLGAVALGVIVVNVHKWTVDPWLFRGMLIGAIVLAMVGSGMKLYDAYLRAGLAKILIEQKGTSDPVVAQTVPTAQQIRSELLTQVLKEPITVNLLRHPGSGVELFTPTQEQPT